MSVSKVLAAPTPLTKVAIINMKIGKGQRKTGTELGPSNLKSEFLYQNLENCNCPAVERTDVNEVSISGPDEFGIVKNVGCVAKTTKKLSEEVSDAIKEGYLPLVLGGDHSLGIGSVHGTASALRDESPIGLIWVDAHADINTPLTTTSGNLHGQPVSFLLYELERYLPKLEEFSWLKPCVSARNLVYIGLRDVDTDETLLIQKHHIKAFSMTDVQQLGIQEVMKQALAHLTIDGKLLPLHVSVDIDSLDPWFAPSTGTPVLGGLTLPELMYIGNTVHESGKLTTLDLVEVNPSLGDAHDVEKTVFSATRAILSFFGYTTLGTVSSSHQVPLPN